MANQVTENSQVTTETNNYRQEFAQMNGAEVKNDSTRLSTSSTDDSQKPEPEEIVTTRPVAAHPLLKGLTISGGVLLLVMSFGAMVGTITDAFNSSTNNQTQENTKKIQPDDSKTAKDEDADMKTVMALTSQKGELQAIGKNNGEPVSVLPTPTIISKPIVKTQPAPTRPTITYQAPPPPPTPVIRTHRNYRVADNPSPIRQPAPVPKSSPKPLPVNTTARNLPPLPSVRTAPKDPMQEWLAVANVGNYSSGDSGNEQLNNEELNLANAKVEGGTGIRPASAVSQNQDLPQSLPTNSDGKQVLVGTRAAGVMETPIAWMGSSVNDQQRQNCLIRLSQPLKSFDGSEVLPKGSYVVAVLNPTNSEIAQMTAVSALVNIDGKTQEKQLPPNSVLILGKSGNLLKAESRKGGSNLGNSLMASLLSGLSKAAEIQNRANNETSISSNGVTTTSTSNGDKNLIAGFTEGSLNEILGRMKTSNEQQLQSLERQQQVFVIEAGKQVQVFVNQSILI
ncbi:TrbI/VirB10 family protein [Nostoc sp. FACHB-190]|uniref:TrbI/VirB10 family protein n=1 Tax=Nostoc sp. FACHB-190 TaxID=2692838 RepID=UPI0016886832|nr:TrbI/VirB10 family protein [Nostoc sp. FACHB-190]MBD2302254.1 hypothetical protein [Nostoc sp. FACHB-190]